MIYTYTESQRDFGVPELELELKEAMADGADELVDAIERQIASAITSASMKDYLYERAASL